MITTVGKTFFRGRIEAPSALFSGTFYMAFSTDATTPALGDTTLTGEQTTNGFARISCTVTHTTGQNTWVFATTPVYTGSTLTTINKIALFDAATSGNLIDEGIVSAAAFNTAGDTCSFSITLSL